MPVKTTNWILALPVTLLLCWTVQGQDHRGAAVSIFADERGTASIRYTIWIDKPLSPDQVQAVESATGVPLDGPRVYDDPDDNDDDSDQSPEDAGTRDATTHVYYTAHRKAALERTGLQFSGDVDCRKLAAALTDIGISGIEVAISHPQKVDPRASQGRASLRQIRNYAYLFYHLDLADAASSSAVLHVVYGDRGPAPGWRFAALFALLFLIIVIVLWFRRLALREVQPAGTGVASLAHTRFVNVVSFVLPVCWWMAISTVDFRTLVYYRLGPGPVSERLLAEGLVGIALPCLIFWACALSWRPVWRAIPVRISRPGDASRSPLDLFLGSFLPMLLTFGGLFYIFEGQAEAGGLLLIGASVIGILRRKLLVKRAELQMYVLLAPELRQRILDLAGRAKVKLRQIFVLPDTGHRMVNAFAAANNTVWLSEYLLRRFSRREVDAIVAHELGHLKRSHPTLRVAVVSLGLLAGLIPSLFLQGMGAPIRHLNLLFPITVTITLGFSFFLARRLEYSADWWSVKINGDPEGLISGLARITLDGQLPLNWSKWDEKLLSHPSTLRRTARIARQNGITRARLIELLKPPAQLDDCYSLATGSSGITPGATNTLPERTADPGTGLKIRTGYSALPPVFGLGAVYLVLLAALLMPDLFGSAQTLLAGRTGIYSLSTAFLAGVLLFVLTARRLKRKLSQRLTSPFAFVPASVDQFSGLDTGSVDACTADLESLGFKTIGNYSIEMSASPDSLKQFLRSFAGEEHNCWAHITQVVTDTLGVTKVSCTFASDVGNGCTLYTSNGEPVAALYAARLPREIRLYVPRATAADLLNRHLARLERIAAESGPVPTTIHLAEEYLTHELGRAAERRQIIMRRNAWAFLFRFDRFNRKPKLDWTGKDAISRGGRPRREQPAREQEQNA